MLSRPPQEREWVSWLAVGLWTLGIFATIPVGQGIVIAWIERMGPQSPAYGVLVVGALLAALAARGLRQQRLPRHALLRLLVVGALFLGTTWSLRNTGGKALHILQYGMLAVLLFRGFSHRTRDAGSYLLAGLTGTLLGTLDEAIQWITPWRHWSVSDIALDAAVVGATLLGIGWGVRPAYVAGPPGWRSLRDASRLALVLLVFLGASLLNTPPRTLWLAENLSAFSFLSVHENVMAEYGHFHRVPGVVRFRSRWSAAELRRLDRDRAAQLASPLDGSRIHTPLTDPFLYELRMHVGSRNQHLRAARQPGAAADEHWTSAYAEHSVLRRYFQESMRAARFDLDPSVVAEMETRRVPSREHPSRVRAGILTRVGEGPVALGLLCALLAAALVERRLSARVRRAAPSAQRVQRGGPRQGPSDR